MALLGESGKWVKKSHDPPSKGRTDFRVIVDYGEDTKTMSVKELVVHEIHRPAVVGCAGLNPITTHPGGDPPFRRIVHYLHRLVNGQSLGVIWVEYMGEFPSK